MAVALGSRTFVQSLMWCGPLQVPARQVIYAQLAKASLNWISMRGALDATFTRRSRWVRTDKFTARPSWYRAFAAARTESIIGAALLAVAGATWWIDHRGLLLALEFSTLASGFGFLMAPIVSLLSEYEHRRNGREILADRPSSARDSVHQ